MALSMICREVDCFGNSKLTPPTCWQWQSESWRQLWPCEMVFKGACCHGNPGTWALSIICREVGCFGNSKLTLPTCCQCQSECWRQVWPCAMVFRAAYRLGRGSLRSRPRSAILENFKTNAAKLLRVLDLWHTPSLVREIIVKDACRLGIGTEWALRLAWTRVRFLRIEN